MNRLFLACFSGLFFMSPCTFGSEDDPVCLEKSSTGSLESSFQTMEMEKSELLARLVWAETESLMSGPGASSEKCASRFDTYAKAIAWTVRSRVELSRRFPRHRKTFGSDWYGVIFKKNQFNPAVSKKSTFRKFFMCPQKSSRFIDHWAAIRKITEKVTDKHSLSPLVTTPFETSEGYSLVAYLYYPHSLQATHPPPVWVTEKKKQKLEVEGLKLDGSALSDECLWMFREKTHE